MSDQIYQQWAPVIGRSLAYIALYSSSVKEKNLGEKAAFLELLGLERKDVAGLLGSSVASVTEALSKAKREKKGAKKHGNTAKRKARS